MTILLTISMCCLIVVVLANVGTITVVAESMALVNNENNVFYMYWSHGPP